MYLVEFWASLSDENRVAVLLKFCNSFDSSSVRCPIINGHTHTVTYWTKRESESQNKKTNKISNQKCSHVPFLLYTDRTWQSCLRQLGIKQCFRTHLTERGCLQLASPWPRLSLRRRESRETDGALHACPTDDSTPSSYESRQKLRKGTNRESRNWEHA